MSDGSQTARRVITAKTADGRDVVVVLEVTRDGYVAAFRKGVEGPVFFDPRGVWKMIEYLRELHAIALRGVRWSNIE